MTRSIIFTAGLVALTASLVSSQYNGYGPNQADYYASQSYNGGYGGNYGGQTYGGSTYNTYNKQSYGADSSYGSNYGGTSYNTGSGKNSYNSESSCANPAKCCDARQRQSWNVKTLCNGCGNSVCNLNDPNNWSRVTSKPTNKPINSWGDNGWKSSNGWGSQSSQNSWAGSDKWGAQSQNSWGGSDKWGSQNSWGGNGSDKWGSQNSWGGGGKWGAQNSWGGGDKWGTQNSWGDGSQCCQTLDNDCPGIFIKREKFLLSRSQNVKITICCKGKSWGGGGDSWGHPTLYPTTSPTLSPIARRRSLNQGSYGSYQAGNYDKSYGGGSYSGASYGQNAGYYGPYQEGYYDKSSYGGSSTYSNGGSYVGGGSYGQNYGGGYPSSGNQSYRSSESSYKAALAWSGSNYNPSFSFHNLPKCDSQYEPTMSPTITPTTSPTLFF